MKRKRTIEREKIYFKGRKNTYCIYAMLKARFDKFNDL
jgi:hypothetical protein